MKAFALVFHFPAGDEKPGFARARIIVNPYKAC